MSSDKNRKFFTSLRPRSRSNKIEGRINWILLFFSVAMAALAGRLFLLQIVNHNEYLNIAARQHNFSRQISPERGTIFARDKDGRLVPLALNKVWKTLIISPREVKNEESTALLVAQKFGLEQADIRRILAAKDDPYEVLLKRIEPKEAELFEARSIEGVFFEDEKRRIYPHGTLAAHLLGFAGKEDEKEVGKYGLERFYERELSGEYGFLEGVRDTAGFWVALGKRILYPPQNGSKIELTVDYNIQVKSEEILNYVLKKWGASSGVILVTEPDTGRILAEAARPAFDPNSFSQVKDFSLFLNPAAEAMYELGSVLKPITMAMAVEEGVVGPNSVYHDPGELKFGSYTIRNFDGKSYGNQTMTQVLEKSLNTGAVYLSRLVGKDKQREYLGRFGFGEKIGIDLPGEIRGDLSNLSSGRDIDFATASFGQGIAVTPMQLAMAMGALANGGRVMRPYVADKVIDDSGNEKINTPEVVRQAVSSSTAETLSKMLVSAVRNGFENRAGVKGYFVAGKTGTAQIPLTRGRGYSDKVIHTFVGYAPAFNPRFLVLLQLNEPQGNRFAANTLTPAFHDLAEYMLNYYEVPPDEK